LLFIAIILEAGLLFAPEVTLIIAVSTMFFSAFAILFGLSSDPSMERHDAYLLMVFTLGLQALAALPAWHISQYMHELLLESERAQQLEFAQARYEALSTQVNDHQRFLEETVGSLLQTISRAMTGDYLVRAEIPDSELTPLADSLNLLLQRYEAATQAEQVRSRMDAAALPMIDSIARMTEPTTPTPTSLPIMTNTPLDSVSVVLSQMQSNLTNRLGRVQRLAGEVVSTLNHSQEPFSGILDAVSEAQRIAGFLVDTSVTALNTTRKQLAQVATMRRMLTPLLPEEITRAPENELPRVNTGNLNPEIGDLSGLAQDLGMGSSGFTGQFPAVASDGDTAADLNIAPLTLPLQALDATAAPNAPVLALQNTGGDDANAPENSDSDVRPIASDELLPELVETWNLTTQIDAELAQLERALSQLSREAGVQSKHLRTADANVAWFRSTLDAVRGNAEQLQQIAATTLQTPGGDSAPAMPSRPLPQSPLARGPQLTRPIPPDMQGDDGTLAELARQIVDGPDVAPAPAGAPGDAIDSLHAPGSLRASDLLSFGQNDFPSLADSKAEPPENEQTGE
jgi:hypothetical protein